MKSNKKHRKNIKHHLVKHGTITSLQAWNNYGNSRLAEYIRQLRAQGMDITMTRIYPENDSWYGLYTLNESK